VVSLNKVYRFISISLVLLAFAGNSILNRLALKPIDGEVYSIDPSSFTFFRLISGALVLSLLILFTRKRQLSMPSAMHFKGALYLFLYAISFSLAYISLDASVGALILFGMVQISIIVIAMLKGKPMNLIEWLGSAIAVSGLLVLTLPNIIDSVFVQNDVQSFNLTASIMPVILMALAGIAWGFTQSMVHRVAIH